MTFTCSTLASFWVPMRLNWAMLFALAEAVVVLLMNECSWGLGAVPMLRDSMEVGGSRWVPSAVVTEAVVDEDELDVAAVVVEVVAVVGIADIAAVVTVGVTVVVTGKSCISCPS